MATHDYNIADQDGPSFLTDLNNLLAAIVSNNSSATEPATTFAFMWWADTTANKLKMRNAANTAWLIVMDLASYRNVVTKAANYTVVEGDNEYTILVDTSTGNKTITLPQISTISAWARDGFRVTVAKATGDTNTVTVARGGTDTINGATTFVISAQYSSATIIADDAGTDAWYALSSGAGAGNMSDEVFTAGTHFTAGTTTALTLNGAYGSETNISVHFDAAFQGPDTYSLSGTTLTFTSAIPVGVTKVYVKGGATLPVGTPSNGSVTQAKIDPTYEAGLAKLATAQNYTAPQRAATLTDNDLSFDLSAKQNFKCTPTAGGTLTFTNPADGLSGFIILVNGSNYAITAAATTKISATALTRISATGTYRLDYASDGTNTYVTASENLG